MHHEMKKSITAEKKKESFLLRMEKEGWKKMEEAAGVELVHIRSFICIFKFDKYPVNLKRFLRGPQAPEILF